jgi:hypothetical protein
MLPPLLPIGKYFAITGKLNKLSKKIASQEKNWKRNTTTNGKTIQGHIL